MPADRRPLPLVTEHGPVCQEACSLRRLLYPSLVNSGLALVYRCEAPDTGGDIVSDGVSCHPAEHAAWLREQERARRVCGRCEHWATNDCPDVHRMLRDDESCSRFEERSDG